jgi:PIN domain nuclease of toxin-antitoxin system
MTHKERETLIEEVRREERARAVSIIRNWEIYSPYIVGKMRIETRKEAIIAAIWGEYEQDYYSGA